MQALHTSLISISLAYGLACFAIAFAIVLVWRRDSDLPFTRALPYLAAFGFLRGMVESGEVLILFHNDMNVAVVWISNARSAVLGLSCLFLLLFGISLVAGDKHHRVDPRWVAPLLFLVWAGSSIALVHMDRLSDTVWPYIADETSALLLMLPGGLMTVWGLHSHKKVFDRLGLPRVAHDSLVAGVLFALYSAIPLVDAFTDMRSIWSPLDDSMYMPGLAAPLDAADALLAIGIAGFIVRIALTYQGELRSRVRRAEQERLRAQEEALEVHVRAAEQLRQWNETLEQRIISRTHELTRRQEETEALYQISTEISALIDLDTILSSVVEKSRYLLEADLAAVALAGDGREKVQIVNRSGAVTDSLSTVTIRPGEALVGQVLSTRKPIRSDEYLSDSTFKHTAEMDAMVVSEKLRAHLSVPVTADGQVIAALTVASRSDRVFTDEDEQLLNRIAVLLSLAIQNSRLHERGRQVAVLEERERLAREIHDGLAQTLGFIGMMSGATRDHLERGQLPRAASDLADIEELARGAYRDAREAILGLRVSEYGGQDLANSLRAYLDRFREQSKLETCLKIHPVWSDALDGDSQLQIVRIVQEALSNVRKHAAATGVSVELSEKGDVAEVAVQDDGIGFDVQEQQESPGSHFGMQTMRERAKSIGAELSVQSMPGHGTRVLVRLPKQGISPTSPVSLSTVA